MLFGMQSLQYRRLDGVERLWVASSGPVAFPYSDGQGTEARLLHDVKSVKDRSVLSMELRSKITDWPSRYYFSPRRSNLLRPLERFLKGKSVLEVGAGCGGVTRYLGEVCGEVVALEGSLSRARIAAARCDDLPTVDVLVSAFQDVAPVMQFDAVTLIGVLEYARMYFPGAGGVDPVDAMLQHASGFLKPDGVLIVAIENQLGLKYFAGYSEDHVSRPMYGIEDLYSSEGVVTFGRAELSRRLASAKLAHQRWHFPFPDYKLPTCVFSETGVRAEERRVDLAPLLSASVVADPQVPSSFLFSLEQAWKPVFRNGLAGELANSFLVVAGREDVAEDPDATLVWHYSVERLPRYCKAMKIRSMDGSVFTEPELLDSEALGAAADSLEIKLKRSEFRAGLLWQQSLSAVLNREGWRMVDLAMWAEVWLSALARLCGCSREALDVDAILEGHLLDAVPRNLVVSSNDAHFIDLEWNWREGVVFAHLLYRGLVLGLLAIGSVAKPEKGTPLDVFELFIDLCALLGFQVDQQKVKALHQLEQRVQFEVNGVPWVEFDRLKIYTLPVRRTSP